MFLFSDERRRGDPGATQGIGGKLVTSSDIDRYRSALEEILRIGTTPDTAVTGTLPGGEVGPIWSLGAKERAFDEIVRIARYALRES